MATRLQVNVDHVATLRQARGTDYPDPAQAALLCEQAGAHGITVHLREDRRHIQDHDVKTMREQVKTRLNLEMAATEEMIAFALSVRPDCVTFVPEKREERTTEGGLDVLGQVAWLKSACAKFRGQAIAVSMFIDPEDTQVQASLEAGASLVEFHTGDYANAETQMQREKQLQRLQSVVQSTVKLGPQLGIAAGHGLNQRNLADLLRVAPQIAELNIGHALVSDSVFVGLSATVKAYLDVIALAQDKRG